MQCLFEALQPVHVQGEVRTGVFFCDYDDAVEALVENGLVEPVFAPEPPVEVPVWEMEA